MQSYSHACPHTVELTLIMFSAQIVICSSEWVKIILSGPVVKVPERSLWGEGL